MCLIDFGVRRADSHGLLPLESRHNLAVQDVDGLAVHVVPLAELAAARKWTADRGRMLSVISATRSAVTKSLSKRPP